MKKNNILSTMSTIGIGLYILICSTIGISCKKGWLDAKPTKSLVIPHTLKDYKSLISGTTAGGAFNIDYGTLTEYGSGDFTVTDIDFQNALNAYERNFYSWASDLFGSDNDYGPWRIPYQKILYTNVILKGIKTIIPSNNAEELDWKQIKGSALFFRAAWHYDVAKQFCKAYNISTASADLGIPLRLNDDFNEISVRSSVEKTYDQITSDLKEAAFLLPIDKPINDLYKCQPTKSAAYAMLARVYLAMSNFDSAFLYADKTLNLYNVLLDFNATSSPPTASTIDINSNLPFARFNNEVILHMLGASYSFFAITKLRIDTNLYKSYDLNDLRVKAFFRSRPGYFTLKGNYDQNSNICWTGLATDEIYLIRAECFARKDNKDAALADLNALMMKRWNSGNGSWTLITATDANDALRKILTERRKELLLRSIRWTDLKRLNMESQFEVTLTKTINGQTYILPPRSGLYVFPIPSSVIQLTGMEQNPR